jgi:glycosyltransferase involved in cell wall biosynthesis
LLAPRRYDVVHGLALGAPGLRRASRSALVVTVHDLAWRTLPEATTKRGRQWHEAALKRALGEAKAFVVPSSSVKDELVAAGAQPRSVTVIAEGADHLPPPQPERATALLERAEVRGPYLLSVSTLEPRKNLRRLLQAYAAARSEGLGKLPLVVVGPRGWGHSGLSGVLPDGVVPLGPVDGAVLAALYAGARAFVYVPLAEGFGLPPLEAMAHGTPVVASDTVPSVHDDSEQPVALLTQAEDTDEIAAALLRITSDRPLAASLAERGAAFARTRSWRAAAARHLELWARLS